MKRMRRLALALIVTGALLLITAIALSLLQNVRAKQVRADYLKQVILHIPSDLIDPPFLTRDHLDLVYTSGQTALAFAAGFRPYEPLFVRLYHRTQGLLDAYQTLADVGGQAVLARPLNPFPDREDFTSPGSLWFQVESLFGQEQEFRFHLVTYQAKDIPPTKGVYPSSVVPGSLVILWCSGQRVGEAPIMSGSVDGKARHLQSAHMTLYPVASDGLLLATLMIALDDPTGQWTIYLGSCEFKFTVASPINQTRSSR
jgi:hypothetical protein